MDPKSNADNHSNQFNPNNDAYWQSRGHDSRPDSWDDDDDRSNNSFDSDDDIAPDDLYDDDFEWSDN